MRFKGRAKRIDDVDLPRLASRIGVGEDELHAILEVETRGRGFDSQNRPKMLFEPHVFYKLVNPRKRDLAVAKGLAYPTWGTERYPNDSYPRLKKAMEIDKDAALESASWGYAQIMGFNHKLAGYPSAEAMVKAFMDDEERHVEAMVEFIRRSGIDDELREIASLGRSQASDWVPIARVYNGSGYKKNNYHIQLATAHNKWRRIRDTPWNGREPTPNPHPPTFQRPQIPSPDHNSREEGYQRWKRPQSQSLFVNWLFDWFESIFSSSYQKPSADNKKPINQIDREDR